MKPIEIVTVQGGYRVRLGEAVHLVNKQRQCSCGRRNCTAIRAVAAYLRAGGQRAPDNAAQTLREPGCPICGAPIRGSLDRLWTCTACRSHYHTWRVSRLRASRAAYLDWLKEHAPERFDLEMFLMDGRARESFLSAHALPYPAGA